jgi:hypothetical protein
MNYHYGIAEDSICNYTFSMNLSIIWIKVSFIIETHVVIVTLSHYLFNC